MSPLPDTLAAQVQRLIDNPAKTPTPATTNSGRYKNDAGKTTGYGAGIRGANPQYMDLINTVNQGRQERGEQPVTPVGLKPGERLSYNQDFGVAVGADQGQPIFYDPITQKKTFTDTGTPYVYTGNETYLQVDNTNVPIINDSSKTSFSQDIQPDLPIFWDPGTNTYTNKNTLFPIFEVNDPNGGTSWAFKGQKQANVPRTAFKPSVWSTAAASVSGPPKVEETGFIKTNLEGLQQTVVGKFGLPQNVELTNNFEVFGVNLQEAIHTLSLTGLGQYFSVQGNKNPEVREVVRTAWNLGSAAYYAVKSWMDDPVKAVTLSLPDNLTPVGILQNIARVQLTPSSFAQDVNVTEERKLWFLSHGMDENGVSIPKRAVGDNIVAGTLLKMQPTYKGSNTVIEDVNVLKKLEQTNKVVWKTKAQIDVDNTKISLMAAMDDLRQLRTSGLGEFTYEILHLNLGEAWNTVSSGDIQRRGTYDNDLIATAKALGYTPTAASTVIDFAHPKSLESQLLDGTPEQFIMQKAQELTDRGFASGSFQDLREALDLTRLAGGGGTNYTDPYFAYTWIDRKDLESVYLDAVVTSQLRFGRPLTQIEAWSLRDNFVDPGKEFVGEMVFDALNYVEVGLLLKPLQKFRTPIQAGLQKLGGVVIENVPAVANTGTAVVDFFKRSSTRSAASKLAHSVNEVFMFMAKGAEAEGLDTVKFYDSIGALGEALDTGDAAAIVKASKSFGDRQVEMSLKLSRILSDSKLADIAPSKWRDLMPDIRAEVYDNLTNQLKSKFAHLPADEASVALHKAVEEVMAKPTNWMADAAQVFKDQYLSANHVSYPGILGGLARIDDKARSIWVKAILAARPAWVIRNTMDNMFRAAVFGMNPFEGLNMFDAELSKRLAAAGISPSELTHTFARNEVARAGETIFQQFLKGDAPSNIWDVFIHNYRSLKDAQGAALATADFVSEPALATMLKNFGHGVKVVANTFMNTVTDWNSVVEYSFKIRMFNEAFNRNTARLAGAGQQLMLSRLAAKGITGKASTDYVNDLWNSAQSSPSELRKMLSDIGYGTSGTHMSTLVPAEVNAMLAGLDDSTKLTFTNYMLDNLKAFQTLDKNATFALRDGSVIDLSKLTEEERLSVYMDEVFKDISDKRNALLNSPDLRDAPSVENPAAMAPKVEVKLTPENPVPNIKDNFLRVDNVDQPTAVRRLKENTGSKDMISNFRDSLGDNTQVRVGKVEGAKHMVTLEGDNIVITVSPELVRSSPNQVRPTLKNAIGDAIQLKYKDEAAKMFQGRSFSDDLLQFLRDPEAFRNTNYEQFRFLAEKFTDNPGLSKTLAGLSNRDYLKFLDIPDLGAAIKISDDLVDALKYMDGNPQEILKYSGPFADVYHTNGTRQAKARALLNEARRTANDSKQIAKSTFLGNLDDRGTYLVSKMNQFFSQVWPGPLTKTGVYRARGWDMFFEAKAKLYDAVANVYDREASRVANLAEDAIQANPQLSFTDWMEQMGFHMEFKADGSVDKIWMQRMNSTERAYMSKPIMDRFIEIVTGKRMVNSPEVKIFLHDNIYTSGIDKIAKMDVAEELMSKVGDPVMGVQKVLGFKQDLYAVFSDFENPGFTYEAWREMVDTSTMMLDRMAGPAMETLNMTRKEYFEKYLPKIVHMKEISDEMRAGGHLLNQELNFYRNGWMLKSKDVVRTAPNAMSADQWLQYLGNPQRGIKKAELEEFGIAEFLRGKEKGKVTKAELQELIDERAVLFVPDAEFRGTNTEAKLYWDEIIDESVPEGTQKWEAQGEFSDQTYIIEKDTRTGWYQIFDANYYPRGDARTLEAAKAKAEEHFLQNSGTSTKWSQYTLPGGTDHFEKLLTTNPTAAAQLPALKRARQEAELALRRLDDSVNTPELNALIDEGKNYQRSVDFTKLSSSEIDAANAKIADYHQRIAKMLDDNQPDELLDRMQELRFKIQDLGGSIDNITAENRFTYSVHWDDSENFFAHYRANTHKSPEGRVFHVDEIQSDLHQQGRKYGYKKDLSNYEAHLTGAGDVGDHYNVTDKTTGEILSHDIYAYSPEDAIRRAADQSAEAVPLFPYKDNWHIIAFKDALSEAVGKDAKYITWTTGRQQFERWGSIEVKWTRQNANLIPHESYPGVWTALDYQTAEWVRGSAGEELRFSSKQDVLEYIKTHKSDGWDVQLIHQGNPYGDTYSVKTAADLEQLPEEAGRDWAPGIWKKMQGQPEGGTSAPILDGMEGFYDQKLPQDVQKYLRSLGLKDVKVEDVKIKIGETKAVQSQILVDRKSGEILFEADSPGDAIQWMVDNNRNLGNTAMGPSANEAGMISKYVDVHGIRITPELKDAVAPGQLLYQKVNSLESAGKVVSELWTKVMPADYPQTAAAINELADAVYRGILKQPINKMVDNPVILDAAKRVLDLVEGKVSKVAGPSGKTIAMTAKVKAAIEAAGKSSDAVIKGAFQYMPDGKNMLYMFKHGDVSTIMHEMAHQYRRVLQDLANVDVKFNTDLAAILSWTGEKSWTIDAEEKFARAFERYITDGVAPTRDLIPAFSKMSNWMRSIYIEIDQNSPMYGLDLDRKMENGKTLRDTFHGYFGGEGVPVQSVNDEIFRRTGIQVSPDLKMKVVRDFGAPAVTPEETAQVAAKIQANIDRGLSEEEFSALIEKRYGMPISDLNKTVDTAFTDELTGIGNLKGFKRAEEAALKSGKPAAFMLVDARGMKYTNDNYGHNAGDAFLKVISKILNSDPRAVAYRTGGDEFRLIVKGDLKVANQIRENLVHQVENVIIELNDTAESKYITGFGLHSGVGATYDEADAIERIAHDEFERAVKGGDARLATKVDQLTDVDFARKLSNGSTVYGGRVGGYTVVTAEAQARLDELAKAGKLVMSDAAPAGLENPELVADVLRKNDAVLVDKNTGQVFGPDAISPVKIEGVSSAPLAQVAEDQAATKLVPLSPQETEDVAKIVAAHNQQIKKDALHLEMSRAPKFIADPRIRNSMKLEAQQMMLDIYNIADFSKIADKETFLMDLEQRYPYGGALAKILKTEDRPMQALVQGMKEVVAGKAATNKDLNSQIRKAIIKNLEEGTGVRLPNPYIWDKLGKDQWDIAQLMDQYTSNPIDVLDNLDEQLSNSQALWDSFVQSPWSNNQSIQSTWGALAQDPDMFAARLKSIIADLADPNATIPVPPENIEALQLLLWQVENYKSISTDFSKSLNTLRYSDLATDSRIPLGKSIASLPENYQGWFAQANDAAAKTAQMADAVVAWKESLLKGMKEGKAYFKLSQEEIQKIAGAAEDLAKLKQNLTDIALYGSKANQTFFGYVQDVMDIQLSRDMKRKLVVLQDETGKVIKREWSLLDPKDKKMVDTLKSTFDDQQKVIQAIGHVPEGALPTTNRWMIDYSDNTNFDETMRRLIPFWTFSSRSIPFWASTLAVHPEILAFYYKYIAFTRRVQFNQGVTTSSGGQMPSLEGFIRIPGTGSWFNPTSALSAKFVIPKSNATYSDEYVDQSPMDQVASWLSEYSQLFGVGLAPMFNMFLDSIGVFKGKPVNTIIPQIQLLPPWWRDYFRMKAYQVVGDSELMQAPIHGLFGKTLPWQDYLVERRMLADGIQRMGAATNTAAKLAIAAEMKAALNEREGNKLWESTNRSMQESELGRAWVGYFVGLYPKDFTDSEIQLQALRDNINFMRNSINDTVNVQMFGLDADAVARYNRYTDAKYNTPEGYAYGVYNIMRYTQAPDGTELTGEDRRKYISQQLHEEEVTNAYYDSKRNLQQNLQAELAVFPIGTEWALLKPTYDKYYAAVTELDANPLYDVAKRPWALGFKPEAMIVDHFKDLWYKTVQETRPVYDAGQEDYAKYLQRVAEWENNLPNTADSLMTAFQQKMPEILAMTPEEYYKQLYSGGFQLQGQRTLDGEKLLAELKSKTTIKDFNTWKMSNDNELDALTGAWTNLYWDKYWAAINGKSGMDREMAERQFFADYPKPINEELAAWVETTYPGKFKPENLATVLEKAGVQSVQERNAPKTDEDRRATEIWDILFMAGPKKTKLQAEYEKLGGYWSDISTWYNVGGVPTAWSKPENFMAMYDKLKRAAANLGLSDPSDDTVKEWAAAQDLDTQLKTMYTKVLGDNIMDVMTEYWNADRQTRAALRKKNPAIDQYYAIQDKFAIDNPVWAKYYTEAGSTATTTKSTGSSSGGSGYSSSKKYYSSGGGGSKKSAAAAKPVGTNMVRTGYRSSLNAATLPGSLGKGGAGGTIFIPTPLVEKIGTIALTQIQAGTIDAKTQAFLDGVAQRNPQYAEVIAAIKQNPNATIKLGE